MPLRVQCAAGHLMMVPDHRAGTVLRCPNCGIDVQVPGAAAGKELVKPRVNLPASAPAKAGVGAARQSAQVAGHSAAKSGIGLPAVKPPPKSRAKPPPLPAAAKKAAPPEKPAVILGPAPSPEPTATETTPDVVFTSPVMSAAPPAPVAEKPPDFVDPALIETVELPPKVLKKKEVAKEEPPQPEKRRAELFEIKDEPAPPPVAPAPEPTPLSEPPVAAPPQAAFHSDVPSLLSGFPDPHPPPITILQGVQPTNSQRHTVWQLAATLAAVALLSIGPSLWEITDYLRSDSGLAVASWAFLLLMLGVVQIASIVLLVQVPDWSSVWIVTLQSLILSAVYAAILGLTIITNGNSALVSTLDLDQQYATGKAPPWCICLAATYACIAFFAGRISAKWRKILRQVQATEQAAAHA